MRHRAPPWTDNGTMAAGGWWMRVDNGLHQMGVPFTIGYMDLLLNKFPVKTEVIRRISLEWKISFTTRRAPYCKIRINLQTSMISFGIWHGKKRKKTDGIGIPEMPLLCFISAFFLTLTTSALTCFFRLCSCEITDLILFFSVSFWRLFVESGWRFHPSQLRKGIKNE